MLNEKGRAVHLSGKETEKRLVHCESAKLPGLYDGKGIIPIIVLIDPEGKVSCATALTGYSEMKKFSIEDVKKWTFKPVEKDGEAVAVYGLVSVRISWDKYYGKDSCDK